MQECFDFYGVTIEVDADSPDPLNELCRDFYYFRVPKRDTDFSIRMHLEHPRYEELPSVPASIITPRNVCFQALPTTYVDYFGRGLAIVERAKKQCTFYSADPDLLHEATYLFVLSTVGEALDQRRIHRVHALAVSYHGHGLLLLLPSGGGKSTMALELLHDPDFRLLAEDTPLVDRSGRILPFPVRVGATPTARHPIPDQHLRRLKRMEFNPKTVIDISYFQDRLGEPAPADLILVGERNLGDVSEIQRMPRLRAFKALLKYMIVGLGVYQGIEFLLERGLWELLGKGGIALSRSYGGMRLLRRASTHRFVLGRNPFRNYTTFRDFIKQNFD